MSTTKTKVEKSFTMLEDELAASITLSIVSKVIISYIRGWQNDGGVCYISNGKLAKKYGIGITTVKDNINACIEHGILERDVERSDGDIGWSSYRELRINEAKLQAFLEAEKAAEPVKKSKRKRSKASASTVVEQAAVAPVITPHTEPVTPVRTVRKVLTNDEWELRQRSKHCQHEPGDKFESRSLFDLEF